MIYFTKVVKLRDHQPQLYIYDCITSNQNPPNAECLNSKKAHLMYSNVQFMLFHSKLKATTKNQTKI